MLKYYSKCCLSEIPALAGMGGKKPPVLGGSQASVRITSPQIADGESAKQAQHGQVLVVAVSLCWAPPA